MTTIERAARIYAAKRAERDRDAARAAALADEQRRGIALRAILAEAGEPFVADPTDTTPYGVDYVDLVPAAIETLERTLGVLRRELAPGGRPRDAAALRRCEAAVERDAGAVAWLRSTHHVVEAADWDHACGLYREALELVRVKREETP